MPRLGQPRRKPPGDLSPQSWRALITLALNDDVRQTPAPRAQRVTGVSHGINPRHLAPLLVHGWARATGERPRLRYRITAAGQNLIDDYPDMVEAYAPADALTTGPTP